MRINLLTERQWHAFRKHKVAYFCLWVLAGMLLISFGADFIANDQPLFMHYQGHSYFPVVQNITNARLGISSEFVQVNYRELQASGGASMVWPLIPFHPNESDRSLADYPSAPDAHHWFGTDDRGRDIAARLLYGLRNSLLFATIVWLASFIIGIFAGGLQGYLGGRWDFITQRVIEVVNSLPAFFMLIILASIVRPNLYLLAAFMVIIGGWIPISYYVRGEFLKLRKYEFVESARAQGASTGRIIFMSILPNAMTPIITFTPFTLTADIIGLAGLDYLGFGLPPPAASWGELLNQALKHFDHAWWLAVYPSLALILTLLVLNFIGEDCAKLWIRGRVLKLGIALIPTTPTTACR